MLLICVKSFTLIILFHVYNHFVNIIIILVPILWKKTLNLREIKEFSNSHTARNGKARIRAKILWAVVHQKKKKKKTVIQCCY